jgi:hypothetical protein
MWDFWWTKWHWGRFSPSTSVSPANSHSTDCPTLIYRPGPDNRPVSADVPSGLSRTPPQETKLAHYNTQVSLCGQGVPGDRLAQSVIPIGCGMYRGDIGIRFPTTTRTYWLFHSVQTGSGARTTAYPMGTVDNFPVVRQTTRLHLVLQLRTNAAMPPFTHTSSRIVSPWHIDTTLLYRRLSWCINEAVPGSVLCSVRSEGPPAHGFKVRVSYFRLLPWQRLALC